LPLAKWLVLACMAQIGWQATHFLNASSWPIVLSITCANDNEKQLDLEPVPNAQAFTVDDPALLTCVQDILWKSAGIVRDETGLTTGLHALATLERDHPRSPAILTAKLIMTSALARKESRGAHFRRDYPVENRNLSGLDTVTSPECKEEIYFLSRRDRPAFIFGT